MALKLQMLISLSIIKVIRNSFNLYDEKEKENICVPAVIAPGFRYECCSVYYP